MIGQYTNDEMMAMDRIISSVRILTRGFIIRKVSKTVNFYRRESDGSWTNYDCKTHDWYASTIKE